MDAHVPVGAFVTVLDRMSDWVAIHRRAVFRRGVRRVGNAADRNQPVTLRHLEAVMDALALLTSDHDEVRGMFEQFRAAKEAENTEKMRSLQQQIFDELETHTRIEEDIFYPAVQALGVEDLTEIVTEGIQEHHVVKVLMREIRDLSDQEIFEAKMTVLMENVEHHAEEEETEMFPDLREHMSNERLEELGVELQAAKA
jgi:hemerythrin superfamily protein